MKLQPIAIYLCLTLSFSIGAVAGLFTVPEHVINTCAFIMEGDRAIGTGFLVAVPESSNTFI